MTKNIFILFYIFFCMALQINAQNAVPAASGNATGAGGSASFTVGQVNYTSVKSTAGSVSQGVQQIFTIITLGLNEHPDINLSMKVYPNPSVNYINLNVGEQDIQNLSFQLFDAQGRLILNQKINSVETSIGMDGYASGNYFLKVLEGNSELKTFKIIKN